MQDELLKIIDGRILSLWFLIGVCLVFWMQAGFAMVEAGFTRAKNAGNIIMKNLMDFCIGCLVFILIGFGLFLGKDLFGIIGKPSFDIFLNYQNFNWSDFIFNLVFCATCATIVSGAMAERTKFLSYCIYSAIISAFIYPIEAHWIWGGGFLSKLGFHDFAGSCAIHMVGGIAALIGAKIVGPRIGKFEKDENNKIIKINAFPGHNIIFGALGVFILWFAWYGFNGATCSSNEQLSSVFLTTTIAPSIATLVCMIITWIKYKKPDVSMCLNASLAGLVAITASCDITDAFGAIIIGTVSGFLVVFGVWLLDYKLHIDDPVGAVSVHMLNGIWGTIALGLFATTSAPGNENIKGLFYGGGFHQLGIQLLGFLVVASWTTITMIFIFNLIKKIFGLRVLREEELKGLDLTEHGLASAYFGFNIIDTPKIVTINENIILNNKNYEKATEIEKNISVPVKNFSSSNLNIDYKANIHKVVIITKIDYYDRLKKALNNLGVTGFTVTNVSGCGVQKGANEMYRGVKMDVTLLPKLKVEVVVSSIPVEDVIETAKKTLYTGKIGDGKIFVYPVSKVVRIRTGEENFDAL